MKQRCRACSLKYVKRHHELIFHSVQGFHTIPRSYLRCIWSVEGIPAGNSRYHHLLTLQQSSLLVVRTVECQTNGRKSDWHLRALLQVRVFHLIRAVETRTAWVGSKGGGGRWHNSGQYVQYYSNLIYRVINDIIVTLSDARAKLPSVSVFYKRQYTNPPARTHERVLIWGQEWHIILIILLDTGCRHSVVPVIHEPRNLEPGKTWRALWWRSRCTVFMSKSQRYWMASPPLRNLPAGLGTTWAAVNT